MKTTIDLPDELVREVKLRAVSQGRPVKTLVAELLRYALGMKASETGELPMSDRVARSESGLPVVRCEPDAPARHMTVDQLLQLEQEALNDEGDDARPTS